MYFDKIKKHFKDGVNIYGANLGDIKNAKFNMLSDTKHEVEYLPEELEILLRFEEKVIELYERAANGSPEETAITHMEIQEGKVVLKEGQICHGCNATLETLTNISIGGVLACEWFGKRESEFEGFLCAFVSKRIKFKNPSLAAKSNRTIGPNECILYFDENNPLMQYLLSIDFFEYENIKRNNPELLESLYPHGIIELYDKIIEPISPAGKKMHGPTEKFSSGWIAIPGGIPPQLINGICISSKNQELISHIEEISQMYPNATIFDENQNVLSLPLIKTSSNESEKI